MYCTNCGAQLPDNANFCRECRQPQQGSPAAQGTGNKVANWEQCDIRFKLTSSGGLFSGPRGCFRAIASGRSGSFVAAESRDVPATYLEHGEEWPDVTGKEMDRIVEWLTTTLSKEGWEPLGQVGPNSWQHRYRRLAP